MTITQLSSKLSVLSKKAPPLETRKVRFTTMPQDKDNPNNRSINGFFAKKRVRLDFAS